MTPSAEAIKKLTIDRYTYLVEDGLQGYDTLLRTTKLLPDNYWEQLAKAQD
jgi:hypothetical protein